MRRTPTKNECPNLLWLCFDELADGFASIGSTVSAGVSVVAVAVGTSVATSITASSATGTIRADDSAGADDSVVADSGCCVVACGLGASRSTNDSTSRDAATAGNGASTASFAMSSLIASTLVALPSFSLSTMSCVITGTNGTTTGVVTHSSPAGSSSSTSSTGVDSS